MLLRVIHETSQEGGLAAADDVGAEFRYENRFTAIPANTRYRPPRKTPGPIILEPFNKGWFSRLAFARFPGFGQPVIYKCLQRPGIFFLFHLFFGLQKGFNNITPGNPW